MDSFISVITSKSDGRVGNVLCAYASLMVGLRLLHLHVETLLGLLETVMQPHAIKR